MQGHKNWVLVVAWSPDGQFIASGDMNGDIWLWDPATGLPRGQCQGHKKWITSLAWEPAHKALPCVRFCTGSKDNMIKVGCAGWGQNGEGVGHIRRCPACDSVWVLRMT